MSKGKDALRAVLRFIAEVVWNLSTWISDSRFGRAWEVVKHYGYLYGGYFGLAMIILNWLPAGGWLGWVWVLPIMVIGLGFATAPLHSNHLCPRCIAGFPLDGPARAARKRKHLWSYHYGRLSKFLLWWMPLALIALLGALFFKEHWVYPAVYTAYMGPLAFRHWWAVGPHIRLKMWCPYCNGNDGEDALEPDPDPGKKRPVPTGS